MSQICQYFTEPSSPSSSNSSKKSAKKTSNTEEPSKEQQYQEALRDLKICWIPKSFLRPSLSPPPPDLLSLSDSDCSMIKGNSTTICWVNRRSWTNIFLCIWLVFNNWKVNWNNNRAPRLRKGKMRNWTKSFDSSERNFSRWSTKNRSSNSSDKRLPRATTKKVKRAKRPSSLLSWPANLSLSLSLSREMEKRRQWLIDLHLSLGNSLCDLSVPTDEHLEQLTSLFKSLLKHLEISDGKLVPFLCKFYLLKKSYGKLWKLLLKQLEEKSSSQHQEIDEKLLQVNHEPSIVTSDSFLSVLLALSNNQSQLFNHLSRTLDRRQISFCSSAFLNSLSLAFSSLSFSDRNSRWPSTIQRSTFIFPNSSVRSFVRSLSSPLDRNLSFR